MKLNCLIFSKDRATQLLALLDSLRIMCVDFDDLPITVLFKTSSSMHQDQYEELKSLYPNVHFKVEENLEMDTRAIMSQAEYILFFVDDCIAIRPFRISDICYALEVCADSVGFSLRLGNNINYCYPCSHIQKRPAFRLVTGDIKEFSWIDAELDFGYPLEVSSSVYRTYDLSILMTLMTFKTVNDYEAALYGKRHLLESSKPNLLCYFNSRVFCNPLNIVSCPGINRNRMGGKRCYDVEHLAQMFKSGMKIDVTKIFEIPIIGCHQDVDLDWTKR